MTELALASGMSSVGCAVFTRAFQRQRDALSKKQVGWEHESMKCLDMAQTAAIRKLFVDGLLKMTLQLKAQVSLYAIYRAVTIQQLRMAAKEHPEEDDLVNW